jgi:hypothetical protein
LLLTASGYEQKALVAQPADVSCNTLADKLSRRQATMAQFLQVPAKDNLSLYYGFVQSRKRIGRSVRS